MSDTLGIIVIVVGLLVSVLGFFLLSRTPRQVLGFLVIVVGFSVAGTGLLTIEDTVVEERPPATQEATPPAEATPST